LLQICCRFVADLIAEFGADLVLIWCRFDVDLIAEFDVDLIAEFGAECHTMTLSAFLCIEL